MIKEFRQFQKPEQNGPIFVDDDPQASNDPQVLNDLQNVINIDEDIQET